MLKKLTTLLLIALVVPIANGQWLTKSKAAVNGAETSFASFPAHELYKSVAEVKDPAVGDTIAITIYDSWTNNIIRNQIAVYENQPHFANMVRPWGTNAGRRTIAYTRIVDGNYVTTAAFDTSANTGWPDIDISFTGSNPGTIAIAAHTPNRVGFWSGENFESISMEGVTDPSVQILGDKVFLASSGDRTDFEFYVSDDFTNITKFGVGSDIVPNTFENQGVEVGMAKNPAETKVAYYGFTYRKDGGADMISEDKDSSDILWMYSSSDAGATWNFTPLLVSGDASNVSGEAGFVPVFVTNIPTADATIDNDGVAHAVVNTYGYIMNGADTTDDRYTVLYWNSRTNMWKPISDPTVGQMDILGSDYQPGRHFGVSYPSIAVDPTGKYLFACWTVAQVTNGQVDTASTPNGGRYWLDAVGTWSTDGGETWSPIEVIAGKKNRSEVFAHSAQHLSVDTEGNLVAHLVYLEDQSATSYIQEAGSAPITQDAIIYKVVKHGPTSVNEDGTVINNFELSQNYPNPFNPTTSIKFNLAERANVSLKVYDMLGREVANILNEVRESGSHTVNFNASMLSSGVYIYKLNAGNFSDVKKMTLLK